MHCKAGKPAAAYRPASLSSHKGIVNVLIDDITVHKTKYAMDVDTFIAHAERIVTEHGVSPDDNDNEPEF